MKGREPALLATADGEVFRGSSVGGPGVATGEAVFNTSMTGYQEILTDPSYAGQGCCDDLSPYWQLRRLRLRCAVFEPGRFRIHHAIPLAKRVKLEIGGKPRRLPATT